MSNIIGTNSDDDKIIAKPDNGSLTGGTGNDDIYGNVEFDPVTYSGSVADYHITLSASNSDTTIMDPNVGDGDEGTDTLSRAKAPRFSKYVQFVHGWKNEPFFFDDT